MLSVQLKYGPWRDVFLAEWSARSEAFGVPVFRRTVQQRARLLLQALRAMCQRMDGYDDSVWLQSLGKNISHASGPLATLNRLKVVFPCSDHRSLHLGLKRKRLCSGAQDTSRACLKLTAWVRLADECVVNAPKTCQDWITEHAKADRIFQKHNIFPPRSYMRNFVIRGLLLAAMESKGFRRLTGANDTLVRDFAVAFPDQSSWLMRLPHRPSHNLQAFFEEIGFDGRPELFSMFTCLLLTKGMWWAPEWYRKQASYLKAAMLEQARCSGVMRLPLLCVQDQARKETSL